MRHLLALRGIRYPVAGAALFGVVIGTAALSPSSHAITLGFIAGGALAGALFGFVFFLNIRRGEGLGSFDDHDRALFRFAPGGTLEPLRSRTGTPAGVARYHQRVRRSLQTYAPSDSPDSLGPEFEALRQEEAWAAKRCSRFDRLLA